MKSLVAEVYVPALDLTLDVSIPVHVTISKGIDLMADIIRNTNQVVLEKSGLVLMDADGRAVLDGKLTFGEARIPDACSLILI